LISITALIEGGKILPLRFAMACPALAPHGHTRDTVKFFTGGYDKAIRLWKVNTSKLGSATSEEVIKLATIPEALAFRRSRHSLLTSTSKRLMDIDLDHLSKKPYACLQRKPKCRHFGGMFTDFPTRC